MDNDLYSMIKFDDFIIKDENSQKLNYFKDIFKLDNETNQTNCFMNFEENQFALSFSDNLNFENDLD